MGLFVRTETTGMHVPLYSVGLNRTVLIVGLGNPGKEYDLTRHNAGFLCLDQFAETNGFPAWSAKQPLKCELTSQNLGETRVVLIKPTTFMNLSGEAVQAVRQFYKVPPDQVVIVHDELDIPFGQIRMRKGGGSAGHNGLKSVIQHGGEDSLRIRIGIHSDVADKADSADFVLGKFTASEQAHLQAMAREVTAIITEYIYGGTLAHDTRTFAA